MGKKYTYIALLAATILFMLLFVMPGVMFSQAPVPNNVTGHMSGVSGPPVAGTYIQFQLTNCTGGGNPRILGYTGIAPSTGVFLPDDTGLITGTIWANDQIDCAGVTGNTRWMVTNIVNNIPQGSPTCYQVLSTSNPFNLDTASPAVPCITSTPILPNDVSFHNLTLTGGLFGVNAVFGGTVQAHKFLLDFTPSPCGSGQFMTGYHADFTPICAAQGSAPVTSVFGRTGAVVQVSGDYNCGQITGAICSVGTVFNQTVQVSGTSFPQEAAFNFIPGANTTIGGADNSGAHRTDITISQTVFTPVLTDVTGSRVFGTTYQNTSGHKMEASGWGTISGGSGDSSITCSVGPSSASLGVFANTTTGTVGGEMVGFACPLIPPTYFYNVTVTNIISTTPGKWTEGLF